MIQRAKNNNKNTVKHWKKRNRGFALGDFCIVLYHDLGHFGGAGVVAVYRGGHTGA